MLSNPDVARQISDLMMDIFTRVHESVEMVQETCGADEAGRYRKATAKVAGAVVMDGVWQTAHPILPNKSDPRLAVGLCAKLKSGGGVFEARTKRAK